METEPPEPNDSTPPEGTAEEPVAPVPTSETTPVWAQTKPAPPPDEPSAPVVPIKKGDPDWTESETPTKGDGARKTPEWAATVPTSPGDALEDEGEEKESTPPEVEAAATEPEAELEPEPEPEPEAEPEPELVPTPLPAATPAPAGDVWDEADSTEPPPAAAAEVTPAPLTEPPKAVAADALKSTWPPRAEGAPAPPEETDIWPPEPPTEKAMPAWPPPSELEEPATPAQVIPSWPDSFDPTAAAPAPASQAEPPKPEVHPVSAAASAPPTSAKPEPETIPPAPPTQQVAPAEHPQSTPASRPAWAPGAPAPEGTAPAAGRESQSTAYQVPAWAPRVPLAGEPGTPTWFSPKEQIPHATAQQAVPPAPKPPPAPTPPVVGGQLPVAPAPKVPEPAPAQHPATGKQAWQVVEQRAAARGPVGPTAEDRSYAEWFAWAKRGGAPASACHAAAQGAFKALSSGKDVTTAVQWATAAMSRPPENVSYARQTYCAWFALANIDLNFDQHRSHAFAGGAVQALDAGADASQAHAAGLAAAGIR